MRSTLHSSQHSMHVLLAEGSLLLCRWWEIQVRRAAVSTNVAHTHRTLSFKPHFVHLHPATESPQL